MNEASAEQCADFSFQGLTPDIIVRALESVDIYPSSGLLALNSYENRVYQFTADDRRRYVAKFYRPQRWSDAQILEEHQFSQALLDAEVPVVAPLCLQQQSLHHFEGYRFCIFPSVGGRAFEPNALDDLERLGRQIGRLHQVARQHHFQHRPRINYHEYVTQSLHTLQQSALVPEAISHAFFAILEPLAARLASTDLAIASQQRLHGDSAIRTTINLCRF